MLKTKHSPSGKTVLVMTVHQEGTGTHVFSHVRPKRLSVTSHGHRVLIHDGSARIATMFPQDAAVSIGPKLLVRLFQAALDGKSVRQKNHVGWDDAETWDGRKPSLVLRRIGGRFNGRIWFVAPCGAHGTMSVREAEKLIAYVPQLFEKRSA